LLLLLRWLHLRLQLQRRLQYLLLLRHQMLPMLLPLSL
jgi:hypothetical protein